MNSAIEVDARDLLSGLKGPMGKSLLLFETNERLAAMCEVNAELVDWLTFFSNYSNSVCAIWGEVRALMDARAANSAIEEMMESADQCN